MQIIERRTTGGAAHFVTADGQRLDGVDLRSLGCPEEIVRKIEQRRAAKEQAHPADLELLREKLSAASI